MAESVGIRELRNHLSAVLRRVKGGEAITVTEWGRPVALLLPAAETGPEDVLRELARLGRVSWDGGRPEGAAQPPLVRGRAVSEAVQEGRR